MADKVVRTHTNQSNREKAKGALERKSVFRSVLDNPFRVQCVPVNIQNSVLARFIDMLQGVPEYRAKHGKRMTKKRNATHQRDISPPTKRRKLLVGPRGADDTAIDTELTSHIETEDGTSGGDDNDAVELRPGILDHMTAGINAVTKLLEAASRSVARTTVGKDTVQKTTLEVLPAMVLVCRSDVSPPELIQHIPRLVAAYNTRIIGTTAPAIHLVPLPKGAESSLAEAIGLRRVSVVALHVDAPRLSELTSLLADVPPLTASWLAAPTSANCVLIPTHIKQLKTTTPKDMRAVKEQRSRGRAEAKARKKARLQQRAQEGATNGGPQP